MEKDEKIDLSCLSTGTLVRYKTFFKITQEENNLQNRNNLIEIINSHFEGFEVNNKDVIDNFLKIENDAPLGGIINTRKSARNQEKVEKFQGKIHESAKK